MRPSDHQHLQWHLHTGVVQIAFPPFLKGDIHCCNTTDMNLGATNFFLKYIKICIF